MRRLLTFAVLACASFSLGLSPAQRAAILSGSDPILFRYVAGDSIAALGGTFSRASTATYTNASGVIQTAEIDALRAGHYIGGVRTTLLETEKTNLLLESAQFNTGWTGTNASVLVNQSGAPDATTSGDKIIASVGAGSHYVARSVNPNGTATFSVWAKAAEWGFVGIYSSAAGQGATFELLTGTKVANIVAAPVSFGSELWPSGWLRVWITVFSASVGTFRIYATDTASSSSTGDGMSGIYAWGAQLEISGVVSSYIPTTSATVTRAPDSLTDTQRTANNTLTQYDRYWSNGTSAWVDAITTISAGSLYPAAATNGSAYRYRVVARGTRDLAWFTSKGYTP